MTHFQTIESAVCSVTRVCQGLCDPLDCSPVRLLCPQDFPGKNTGMGCHFLLQGIFLTQRLNLCLLHWQKDSLSLSHQGSLTHLLASSKFCFSGLTLASRSMAVKIICRTANKNERENKEILVFQSFISTDIYYLFNIFPVLFPYEFKFFT